MEWPLSTGYRILFSTSLGGMGFPGGLVVDSLACHYRSHWRCGFHPWGKKIPWRRQWLSSPVFLPGEFPQTEETVGVTRKLDTTEHTYPLGGTSLQIWSILGEKSCSESKIRVRVSFLQCPSTRRIKHLFDLVPLTVLLFPVTLSSHSLLESDLPCNCDSSF